MLQEVERKIVGAAVDSLLGAGYRITVSLDRGYDIDECLLGSRDKDKIMEEAFAGDECHLFVHEAEGDLLASSFIKCLKSIGWIYCVFGNYGYDVICDYTTNLEPLMAEANKLSDQYQ
jgi:hypothetical protein